MKRLFKLILLLLLIAGCTEQGTNPDKRYDVSGYILQKGLNVAGVTVSLDNKINWTDQTDDNGYFKIEGVTEGDHLLKSTQTQGNGTFVEKSFEVAVYDDILLDALRLPVAVDLLEPTMISSSSMNLAWIMSDADSFREYKLYRHNTSGLDENTGTLVHVATSIMDTTFVDDQLSPFHTYYYRLYVMNDFGRLGGSNIMSATTEQYDFIWNGDFEADDDLLTWWSDTTGIVEYSEQERNSGERSLFMIADSTFTSQWIHIASITKSFFSNPLEGGRKYKLSGYAKTLGLVGPSPIAWGPGAHIRLSIGDGENYVSLYLELEGNTDWTFLEQEFTAPSTTEGGWIDLGSTSKYTWFDDIKLELSGD